MSLKPAIFRVEFGADQVQTVTVRQTGQQDFKTTTKAHRSLMKKQATRYYSGRLDAAHNYSLDDEIDAEGWGEEWEPPKNKDKKK